MIVIVVYSVFVSLLYHWGYSVAIPVGPFEYAGLIMGLILVFRLNAGYDRWWEARKMWGNIVNHSRNLGIIITNYVNPQNVHRITKLTNYISALPYVMKNCLRQQNDLRQIAKFFDKETLALLANSENRPNVLFSLIAHELAILRKHDELDPFAFLQAEEQRTQILNSMGACERILYTPMPFVMAIKSRRFILLFLLSLPLAMVNISLYVSPVVTGLVAYALFSLDQIGIELQNPFSQQNLSHLPLNEICHTIEGNIQEICGKHFTEL